MSKGEQPSFERNQFFYGKLLTVRDFQTEQNYFNEKRHLLNRLIHGFGVVSGLHVHKDGDKGFVISPGVAIDDCGREIVVNKSSTHTDIEKLSVDPEGVKGKTVYLSLHYEECLTEPIHVPSNSSCCQESCESNRIKEGFKVNLTETALEPEAGLCSLLNEKTMIYENDNIRIERIVPRWARLGDVFEVEVRFEVLQNISGKLVIELQENLPASFSMLQSDGLRFSISNEVKGKSIERRYVVRAGGQSGVYHFEGTLFDSDDNGSLSNPKIVKENSVEILSSQDYTHKVAEQYFEEQIKSDEKSSNEQTGVILASITCNSNGQITEIDDSIRQYVYNNPLLSQLISCEENQFGKLPKHGLTHQFGGSDPINVENLNGVLAQPQKVDVYSENMKQHVAQKLRFTGEGISVEEDPKDKGLVNISVPSKEIMVYTDGDHFLTANRLSFEGEGVKVDKGPFGDDHVSVSISNVTGKHAKTHVAGGSDPINVTNLPGVLSEPQKIYVQQLQKKIIAKELHFSGSGVNVSEDNGNAYVNISGGNPLPGGNSLPVLSGTVVFTTIGDGMAHSSPDIELKMKDPAIILALEDPEKNIMIVEMGAGVEQFEQYPTIRAFYDKEKEILNIYLYEQAESNKDVKWIVRWWAVQKTEEMDQVEGKPIEIF